MLPTSLSLNSRLLAFLLVGMLVLSDLHHSLHAQPIQSTQTNQFNILNSSSSEETSTYLRLKNRLSQPIKNEERFGIENYQERYENIDLLITLSLSTFGATYLGTIIGDVIVDQSLTFPELFAPVVGVFVAASRSDNIDRSNYFPSKENEKNLFIVSGVLQTISFINLVTCIIIRLEDSSILYYQEKEEYEYNQDIEDDVGFLINPHLNGINLVYRY